MRTKDGSVSAHFENTVAISEKGAIVLGLGLMGAARNQERSAVAS